MRPQIPQEATLLTLFKKLISRKIKFYRLHVTLNEVADCKDGNSVQD